MRSHPRTNAAWLLTGNLILAKSSCSILARRKERLRGNELLLTGFLRTLMPSQPESSFFEVRNALPIGQLVNRPTGQSTIALLSLYFANRPFGQSANRPLGQPANWPCMTL